MPRLRTDALTWRNVEGEIVALELATSTYLAVNQTGAFLWPSLVEGASENDLATKLVQTYAVSSAQANADVEAFLTPLRERGLLEQ